MENTASAKQHLLGLPCNGKEQVAYMSEEGLHAHFTRINALCVKAKANLEVVRSKRGVACQANVDQDPAKVAYLSMKEYVTELQMIKTTTSSRAESRQSHRFNSVRQRVKDLRKQLGIYSQTWEASPIPKGMQPTEGDDEAFDNTQRFVDVVQLPVQDVNTESLGPNLRRMADWEAALALFRAVGRTPRPRGDHQCPAGTDVLKWKAGVLLACR